jgi:hypothetical protein
MQSVLFDKKNNLPEKVENNLMYGYVSNGFFPGFLDRQKIDALKEVCDKPEKIDSSVINYSAKS